MTNADNTRRSKKEIADALKAQIVAITLNTLIVSGAGTSQVNGRYVLDEQTNEYVHTVTEAYVISGADNNWILSMSGASAYQTTTGLTGTWATAGGEDGGDDPGPTVELAPAFGRVEVFDLQDLTDALRILMDDAQRICVIVMLDETFESQTEGAKIFLTRSQPVVAMISDRVLGDRVKALWGDDDEQGAFGLAELVLPAVTGQIISAEPGKSGVLSIPKNLYSIFLTDEDRKNLAGRAAVSLELNCSGGVLETKTDLGPTL